MSIENEKQFESQVHDCLAHLYDYSYLKDHALVDRLCSEISGSASRVQAFRQIVSDAIERLKPDADINIDSAQTRTYRILMLRYLKQHSTQQILRQLNLSERQFYRDHIKAVQALAQLLLEWDKGVKPAASTSVISIQSEIARLHDQSAAQSVLAKGFLEKVVAALHDLADQHGVEVYVQAADDRLAGGVNLTILRQTVIWILSQLLIRATDHNQVMLSYRADEPRCQFVFEIGGMADFSITGRSDDQEVLQSFLTILDGTIVEEVMPNGRLQIILELLLKRHPILIIDDNPDAITLFRRYLTGQPYKLLMASDGTQAVAQACESQPKLIILDVMLPHQDGWETLQSLKNHPETQHIPVLICSVLNTPDLAHSLGADGFLRKPPGERDFLAALAQFTGTETPSS